MNEYGEGELAMMEVWNNTDISTADVRPAALSLTADEFATYSAIFSDIRTYVQQSILEFITGTKSMDAFDAFVEEVEGMGIDECTQIHQDALDRYNQR